MFTAPWLEKEEEEGAAGEDGEQQEVDGMCRRTGRTEDEQASVEPKLNLLNRLSERQRYMKPSEHVFKIFVPAVAGKRGLHV